MQKIMRSFRDVPIQRKLVIVGLATAVSAIVLSTVIFLVSAFTLGRRNYKEGVHMIASIVADNLTAAASFKDSQAASQTLHGLQAMPTVHLACAYAVDFSLLAQMTLRRDRTCPRQPPPDQLWVSGSTVFDVQPIVLEGRRVGTLYLEGNLVRLGEQLRLQGVAALVGAFVGLVTATWIAIKLHRQIADPITSLSKTAAQISRDADYTVRAAKIGKDEIGTLVDTFNDMVTGIERRDEELRAANRMKDEFLAALSHELRTPLNAIVGWLQILRTNPRDPVVVDQAIVRLDRNARAQVRLIEDLLDISRIVSGKLELKVSAVDLVPTVQSALDVIRPAAEAKGIALAADLPESPCLVSGDADRLQQVLVNLLSNGVKFTPNEGRIEVSLRATPSSYTIAVRDNGIGISREFLPQVFDRFRQADGSITRQHGGLGLGLAIARDLIALHQGRLEASSPGPGQGATFTIVLPRSLGESAPAREARAGGVIRLDGLRVLVTDDDADARMVAEEALSGAGARVAVAADAVDALSASARTDFDAFVCDLQMPEVDGYALLRDLRARAASKGRSLPAVAVTAHASVTEQTRARQAGFQQVVTKPYDFAVLVTAVAQVTRLTLQVPRRTKESGAR